MDTFDDQAALADVRGYARAGRIHYTRHAREQMTERNVRAQDVQFALARAATCTQQQGERWLVVGPDLAGAPLTLVIVLDDGAVVVTVWG